jgi:hypothetical protein
VASEGIGTHGSAVRPGETNRWSVIAKGAVAIAWGLSGLAAALAMPGTLKGGVALIPIALAYYLWPSVVRWPMFAFVVLSPIAFLAWMHVYYHARTGYPLILWACAGVVAHGLLLFGKMTLARLLAGGAAFLLYSGGARFAMPASAPPRESCEARVDALTRRVGGYLAAPPFGFQPREATLPQMSGRARATAAFRVFEVTPTGSWLGKRQPDDPAQAAAQLRAYVEHWRAGESDASKPVGIYLAADAETPVAKIAALFAPLTNVRVLLLGKLDTGPLGLPPPTAKALAKALDSAPNTSEYARLASGELSRRAGPCASLAKRLVQLNDQPVDSKPAFLVTSLDGGLRECQCGLVDLDALEYLVMRILDAPAHDFGEVPLPSDGTGRPQVPNEPGLTVQKWLQRL